MIPQQRADPLDRQVEQRGQVLLTVIDRGADMLEETGQIGGELAAALKAEARRSTKTGAFFGQIIYTILLARRPASAG